jgi:two-component system cell cycle response regulator
MASILVIDDNEDALLIIAYQLTRHGHTLMTAHDGSTGLAVAQREHPDLILCDIRMPQMSGYEVVDRLKHDPTLRQTPVVALTAVGEVDRAKALAAGFDAYISKPVPAQTLIEHIEAVLVRRRNGRAEN